MFLPTTADIDSSKYIGQTYRGREHFDDLILRYSPSGAARQNIAFLNATSSSTLTTRSHDKCPYLRGLKLWLGIIKSIFRRSRNEHLQSLPEERARAFCTMLNMLLSKNTQAKQTQAEELTALVAKTRRSCR
jgi:hypothetical protein